MYAGRTVALQASAAHPASEEFENCREGSTGSWKERMVFVIYSPNSLGSEVVPVSGHVMEWEFEVLRATGGDYCPASGY